MTKNPVFCQYCLAADIVPALLLPKAARDAGLVLMCRLHPYSNAAGWPLMRPQDYCLECPGARTPQKCFGPDLEKELPL